MRHHRQRHVGAIQLLCAVVTVTASMALAGCAAEERPPEDSTLAIEEAAQAESAPMSGADSAGGGPSTASAPSQPLTPARDADQDFLRHMLDHHEAVITLAHAQMMAPAGHSAHGGGADPTAFDSRLDAEKLEMLALLSRLYDESYSPRAERANEPVAARTATTRAPTTHTVIAGAAAGAAPEGEEGAAMRDMVAQYHAGVALVDRSLPRLTRHEVREIARRIRASQLDFARQLGPGAAH
jgi:uncharacterized protein (DUF305 family)